MELKDYKQELETQLEAMEDDTDEYEKTETELNEIEELLDTLELF